jgi:gamma-glutamyltranspeptidase/glutathione hydrolase
MSDPNSIRQAGAATSHPEAGAAARGMLERGGNAIDAACAAVLAMCVAAPQSVAFGGYGGSMIAYIEGRGVVSLDFDSRAPLAYRDELYNDNQPAVSNTGYLAISVPGVVAGIDMALHEFGTTSFRDAAAHALKLAEQGFVMSGSLHKMLEDWKNSTDPASFKAYFPSGVMPKAGEKWIQPDLARFIRKLCDDGPTSFYHGEIPRQIVRQVHDHGGILSEEDFEKYKPTRVEPLTVKYRGHHLYTPPPPSGGITSLQILKALEHFDVKSMDPAGAKYFHTLAEVTKSCWQERDEFLGDPDFVKIPYADLLSAEKAAETAKRVTNRASELPPTPKKTESPDTVNIVTADQSGNVVSLTATQGGLFGSGVVIEGLGLILGHGMSRFTYEPGSPNSPAPGKRMHHNMSPLLALVDGKPRFAIGMIGGPRIVNGTAQIAASLIDFKQGAAKAVLAPQLHTEGAEPIEMKETVAKAVTDELQKMGHKVKRVEGIGGPANVLAIDSDTGELSGASGNGPDGVVVL